MSNEISPVTISFMKLVDWINKTIELSFYALFILVPLILAPNTSELFEFNKIWLTFGITSFIGALWFSKMVILKKVVFRRTLFDLPIVLFLSAMIISTIFSMDPHISLWGYYSRWNGGLLSIVAYLFLYYAFVSNFFMPGEEEKNINKKWYEFFLDKPTGIQVVKRSVIASIISGLIVAFWTIPSHFGYDPTCLFFRRELNVACWTNDFQPKVRAFGPLGQPDWLAGYMTILIPLTLALAISAMRETKKILNPKLWIFGISFFLFYICLLFSGSRSGITGGVLTILILIGLYLLINIKNLKFLMHPFVPIFIVTILILSFFIGVRVPFFDKISFSHLSTVVTTATKSNEASPSAVGAKPTKTSPAPAQVEGGTNSLIIRKIVWKGALDAWRDNPILGTGVETFAFAYYKYRPIEHNTVSEWNFLYNKAHNEYLNYLTTMGIFGLGTYLFLQAAFIIFALINIFRVKVKSLTFLKADNNLDLKDPTIIALFASFIGIIFINFFGFSVVIMNIYLFIIPGFALVYLSMIKPHEDFRQSNSPISYAQWSGVAIFFLIFLGLIWFLIKGWSADTSYAMGMNLDRANQYQTAYPYLEKAVKNRPEPVFEDEFSVNQAILGFGYAQQEGSESAAISQTLIKNSLETNEKLIRQYPHNLLYWKSRIRILYTLAQIDLRYLPLALDAAKEAEKLAPTDATILYNVGVITGQNGDRKKGMEILEKTIKYKPNYGDAYLALATFYHDEGTTLNEKTGIYSIKDPAYHQKAIDLLNYYLTNVSSEDTAIKQKIEAWEKER